VTIRSGAAPLIAAAAALAVSPAARADARADGMRSYRAGRFAEALAAFETAARKRPADPEALADVALALQKLGRNDDAIAANRKVVELASRPGKGAARLSRLAKIRQGAYFNLGRLGSTVAVPEVDACGRIANADAACKQPLFACRMSRLDAGSGLGTHWDVLRVARGEIAATFDEDDDYHERPPLIPGLSDDMYNGTVRTADIVAGQEGDGLLRYGEEETGDECARIHGSEWSCSRSEEVRKEALHCLGAMAPESATNYQLETAPASASCYRRACERAEKAPWPAVTREEDRHTKELQACYEGLTEIEDTTCVVVYADVCTGFVGTYCTTTVDRQKGKPKPDRHRAYEIVVPVVAPAGS
jgi:hypothetical protein